MLKEGSAFAHILFDLDGTLVDSSEDILDSLAEAYRRCSVPVENSDVLDERFIGPPLDEMIRMLTPSISEEGAARIVREFRSIYDHNGFPKTRLYQGVREQLQRLHQEQRNLFIATNKRMVPTRKILAKTGMDCFRDVITSDAVAGKKTDKVGMIRFLMQKWNLPADCTVMVGDTASDIQAARVCGIAGIGIEQGYGDREEMIRSKPDYLIANFNMLETII